MLITQTVTNYWNSKNKKTYVELGYKFTKMKDAFEIKTIDLINGSNVRVEVECDYCGTHYQTPWYNYIRCHNGIVAKDCCNSPKCTGQKAQEVMIKKYGVKSCIQIPEVKEKMQQTNLARYGSTNPFSNEDIKNKIREHNIKTYGGPASTCSPEIIAKSRKTCLEKYGVDNYSRTDEFKESVTGEKNARWKGGNRKTKRADREEPEYREWRKDVFARDHYTCQICGEKNHKGRHKTLRLECHHLNCYKDFPNERFDVNNGITLCEKCHKAFHTVYGIKHTTKEQFIRFKTDKKVC